MGLNTQGRTFGALVSGLSMILLLFATGGPARAGQTVRQDHPYPWNHPGCPCATTLHAGTPAAAGLDRQALEHLDGTVSRILVRRVTPGAVVLVVRRGVIAKWKAYGYASIYKNADYDFVADPRPMRRNEIFDLASVSKLFTATAVMQLWDEGRFKLDDPVAKYLPAFGANGKEHVTIRELLTHTSGFRPDPPTPLYQIKGTREDRLKYVLGLPLKYPPRTHYVYSDINFIVLGALIERLSGEREDAFIRQHLTAPLHMKDTMYHPPARLKPRIAATEYQPWTHRGLLLGQVDDENAWALGGVAGHAGLFSSAHDLAIFGQMMLNGGTYGGVRVLSRRAVKLLSTNWNKKFPDNATGLGWSMDRDYFMGALSAPDVIGHEGFTGTTLVVDPKNDLVGILLMNRVHPTRDGASDVVARRQVYTDVADAIAVPVPGGGKAWFSGYGNHLRRSLTARLDEHAGTKLSFRTWYRIQSGKDFGRVETSMDGKHWSVLKKLTGVSHGWHEQTLALPAKARYVRFTYRTDKRINGRGWYLDRIRIDGRSDVHFETDGWIRRDH